MFLTFMRYEKSVGCYLLPKIAATVLVNINSIDSYVKMPRGIGMYQKDHIQVAGRFQSLERLFNHELMFS